MWFGLRLRGRTIIEAGHEQVFRTVYAGIDAHFGVDEIRPLGPDAALVRVAIHLGPTGEALGTDREPDFVPLMVIERRGAHWQIAAFQNTRVDHERVGAMASGGPRPSAVPTLLPA